MTKSRPRSWRLFLVAGPALTIALGSSLRAENWPRFRGPNGTGIATDKDIPIEWTETCFWWKTALPGGGHSSPIVWGDRGS
jgi:hypothetical protein